MGALRMSMPVATEVALRRIVPWRHPQATEQQRTQLHSERDEPQSRPLLMLASAAVHTARRAAADAALSINETRVRVHASSARMNTAMTTIDTLMMALPPARPLAPGEARDELCAICHERLAKGGRLVR